MSDARYAVVRMSDIEPVDCPCGRTRRAFREQSGGVVSFHVFTVGVGEQLARRHYHRTSTEVYYVLGGAGRMELDGRWEDLVPGKAILVKPGCRHRAEGDLTIALAAVPAFDPADEYFD